MTPLSVLPRRLQKYSAELEQLANEIMELLADRISLRIMKADQEALEESRYLDSEQWRQR